MIGFHLVVVTFQCIILFAYCIEVFRGLCELLLRSIVTTLFKSFLQLVTFLGKFCNLSIQALYAVSLCSESLCGTFQIEVGLFVTVACDTRLFRYSSVELVVHLTEAVADNNLFVIP